MLKRYFTSVWYKPDDFPYSIIRYLPLNIQMFLMRELIKRCSRLIDKKLVEQIPVYELFGQIIKTFSKSYYAGFIYRVNKKFDKNVSKRIRNMNFDVFIGYETATLESFKSNKEKGKICILDLAAEHYKFQRKTWNMVNMDPYQGDTHLRDKVEKIKDEELAIADYIFTPSNYAKKTLLDVGIPEGKIFKIPYGYNTELFKPKQSYRKSGCFKILYASSITKRKGIQYLLQSFKELNLKNANLVIIGGMADGKDILKQHEGLFEYIPFLHHEEIVKHYQDADIFVLPSLLDSFAMVVLEAMACGTPVIVSENTGAKDLIKEGENGYIIPIMDTEALKEKILWCYNNRDKLEDMGKNARIQVEQYTWKRYRERIREAIMSIIKREKGEE